MNIKPFLLAILLAPSLLFAQLEYKERIEIDLKEDHSVSEINPMGSRGLLMIMKDDDSNKGERDWTYNFYNTDLQTDKVKEVSLSKKLTLEGTVETEEVVMSLYKRDGKGEYEIVTYLSQTEEIIKTKGEFPKKFIVSGIYLLDEFTIVSGYVKGEPVLFRINWNTGIQKILPINISDFKAKDLTIVEVQTLGASKELFVLVKAVHKKTEGSLYVLKYNDSGKKEGMYALETDGKHFLLDNSTSRIADEEYIITGTFTKEQKNSTSNGIYFGKVDHENIKYLKYYDYLDLDDFLSYLPEKKQEKIEKKKRKQEKKGKELDISYSIVAHDVITLEDGYLFVGEAYYSTYRTVSNTTFVNGVAQTTYTTVFDGYQYTHAVIAKFSKTGEKMWDKSFELNPGYKPYTKVRFISVSGSDEKQLKMAYGSKSKIVLKSVDLKSGEVILDKESSEIELYSSLDKVKENRSFSKVKHWYDDYFIAYGTQQIKNKDDGKRNVYFISKVQFKGN